MQPIPAWMLSFLKDVYAMRDAEKKYFAHPSKHNLQVAKMKESVVDNRLALAIKNGLLSPPQPPPPEPTQPDLFSNQIK